MPPLSDLLKKPENIDESIEPYPLAHLQPLGTNLPTDPHPPVANPIIRCPLPSMGIPNSDSLRQFYSNTAPKFRIFPK